MAQLLEDVLPPIQSAGLNTNKAVSFGSTLAVTGASTLTGAVSFTTAPTFTGGVVANVVSATTGATLTLAQSGSTVLFNSTTGVPITLPVPSTGVFYNFVVAKTPAASSHGIITNAGTVFLSGNIAQSAGTMAVQFNGDNATAIAIRMNGTTTGGSAGTQITVRAVSSTLWSVTGQSVATGAFITPFYSV